MRITSSYFPPAPGGFDHDDYINHVLYRFTADGQWDEFLQAYFGAIGMAPEEPVNPGRPPRRPTGRSIYLPLVNKGG
jgi:hypothetical protein